MYVNIFTMLRYLRKFHAEIYLSVLSTMFVVGISVRLNMSNKRSLFNNLHKAYPFSFSHKSMFGKFI